MFGGRNSLWEPKSSAPKPYIPSPLRGQGRNRKSKYTVILVAMLIIHFVLDPLGAASRAWARHSRVNREYPGPHPFSSSQTVPTGMRYIFPHIEDHALLKELTAEKLVMKVVMQDPDDPESTRLVIRHMNNFDDSDPAAQLKKETEENEVSALKRAQNTFKNLDKVVYRDSFSMNYPKVVVVTLLDFEKYSHDLLVKIIQNRIDYAHIHKFAVYSRWAQEFLPFYKSIDDFHDKEKANWARLYCMRAAMLAFPGAEWFWFLDENSLIMNMDINIQEQLLAPQKLASIALPNQPITLPNGDIRTFQTAHAENIKVVALQAFDMMQTFSFAVRNDDLGKAYLNVWSDDLYLGYPNFAKGPDSALTHLLQWHPFYLRSTAVVPANYLVSPAQNLIPTKDTRDVYYEEGDLAVYWGSCASLQECDKKVALYFTESVKLET